MKFSDIILFEDNHLLILNKPAGMLVQKDKEGNEETLEDLAKKYIKLKENKEGNVYLGIPHRIDRPTSGIVIFCKSSKALVRVNQMFQDKKIKKTYWAVIPIGKLIEKGHWTHYLKRSEKQNKSFVSEKPNEEYKKAELRYKIISKSERYQMVEVELLTGRHHQIRAQFSHMGFPLKGDVKYGAKRNNEDNSIDLHSRYVVFLHPVTKEDIRLTAPIRQDSLWKFFEKNLK